MRYFLLLTGTLILFYCSSQTPQVRATGEERDEDGATPLIRAARLGETALVKNLIQEGADVNAVDNYGWTALIWACDKGFVEIAQALVEAKANLNHRDTVGATPLIRASARGHTEIVKLLLAHKANLSIKTNQGNTALTVAANEEIKKLLMEQKALP